MDTLNTVGSAERTPATEDLGFRRILVVTDRSDASRAAFDLAREWAALFGAALSVLEVSEAGRGSADTGPGGTTRPATQNQESLLARGATLGARNRSLAAGIAEAARDSGSDAIVLGVGRHRMAQRHLGRSLRDQVARATDLPVLIGPVVEPQTGSDDATSAPSAAPAPARMGRRLETAGRHGRA